MQIAMIILGGIFILCGISCMVTPLITVMELGGFLILLLLAYGIARIIKSVSSRDYGLDFAFGILSVILGIVILVVPGLKVMTTGMLMYIMAGWFIMQGIVSIYKSLTTKQNGGSSKWIWGVCSGVLCIVMGIYSAVHPVVLALTLGLMVGFYFIVSGINMIVMSVKMEQEGQI